MFTWLNGPGSVFRDPLPGSTNYLNAYNKGGQLIRVQEAKKRQEKKGDGQSASEIDEDGETAPNSGRDNKKGRSDNLNYQTGEGIPAETEEDMIPFPANKQFRSQAVLSEELKEGIWHLVTQKGVSVRRVSATYHVDMRRVAAVVRLKEVEKQWEREVSFVPSFQMNVMMRQIKQNRLVLKTLAMVIILLLNFCSGHL